MTQRNIFAALTTVKCHQIRVCLISMMSIMFLMQGVCAQPNVDDGNSLADVQQEDTRPQNEIQQLFLNELLGNVNENTFHNEMQKYQRQQPHYLKKWPGLREMLLFGDYGDEVDNSGNEDKVLNVANIQFIDRLRQLGANAVDDIDDTRSDLRSFVSPTLTLAKKPKAASAVYKGHGIKKNIQLHKLYMSPCHFKICNMGRKRDARYVVE